MHAANPEIIGMHARTRGALVKYHQLLGPAMLETNMRVNALYDLAVELEYKTQHPMGCRVLGPKIDGEIADSRFGHSGLTLAAGATPSRSHRFRDDQVDATVRKRCAAAIRLPASIDRMSASDLTSAAVARASLLAPAMRPISERCR